MSNEKDTSAQLIKLEARGREISLAEETLDNKQKETRGLIERLKKHETHINNENTRLNDRANDLDEREVQVVQREGVVAGGELKLQQLDTRSREILSAGVTLDNKKNEVAGLLEKLSQREIHIDNKNTAFNDRINALVEGEAKTTERERVVKLKESVLDKKYSDFTVKSEELNRKAIKLTADIKEFNKLKEILDQSQQIVFEQSDAQNKRESDLKRREDELQVNLSELKINQRDSRRVLKKDNLTKQDHASQQSDTHS